MRAMGYVSPCQLDFDVVGRVMRFYLFWTFLCFFSREGKKKKKTSDVSQGFEARVKLCCFFGKLVRSTSPILARIVFLNKFHLQFDL